MSYDVIKALHLISVMSWMAGLLYLPRLFVYHAETTVGSVRAETFKIMERRLLKAIIVSEGDHFGEGALLDGRDRRNCTVRCIDAGGCGLGVLSKGAFEAMLQTQPELAEVSASRGGAPRDARRAAAIRAAGLWPRSLHRRWAGRVCVRVRPHRRLVRRRARHDARCRSRTAAAAAAAVA